MKCCLKNCGKDVDIQNESRIEVKTVLPSRFSSENFLVSWSEDGEAKFHTDCWQRLLNMRTAIIRKVGTKRSQSNSQDFITKQEKALIREAKKTAEYFDSVEQIKHEASRVAEMLKSAKHCVAFTGAGISTAAGIGDYRGKSGKWTEMDQSQVTDKIEQIFDIQGPSPSKKHCPGEESSDKGIDGNHEEEKNDDTEGVDYEELRPTLTHEALCFLIDMKLMKHVISQNGDGLHGLSGISQENLSELHGNVFHEKCEKCGHRYDRSFYVMDDESSQYYEDVEDYGKSEVKKPRHAKRCETCGLSHRTGRKCEQKGCSGFLMDTIINFGDNLEEDILSRAFSQAYECDLMIGLGTTLTVTPANELVEVIKKPQRLVICNRQKTDYDKDCLRKLPGADQSVGRKLPGANQSVGSRVHGDCDVFMREVLKNIVGEEKLKSWERDRQTRMISYNKQRQQTS